MKLSKDDWAELWALLLCKKPDIRDITGLQHSQGQLPRGIKKLSLSKHLPADPAQRMLAAGWAALRSMGPMGAPRASLQQLRGLRGGQLDSARVQSKESQVTLTKHLQFIVDNEKSWAQVAPGQTIVLEEASLVKETQDRINTSLVSDPGRLFAVLHIRGHQHKVILMLLSTLRAIVSIRSQQEI